MNDLTMPRHRLRGYVSHGADLRSGKLSPKTYLEETLTRITQLDKDIGAFVVINREGARRAADESAKRWLAGKPLSPIDGMPVAIKDIIETADMPTGQGSPMWEGADWKRDGASVHALREVLPYSGTAPICCMRVMVSVAPQCSTTLPSSMRMMSTPLNSTLRPLAATPISSP